VHGLPDHGFSDVPRWVDAAVTWIAHEGLVSGYDNGTFRPNRVMARAALSRILYRQSCGDV
jgi:hypothetical protein